MTRARDLADSADLAFDGDTLKIDSTNNRVGIGTASPSEKLDVAGHARATSFKADGTGSVNKGFEFAASGSTASAANMFAPAGYTLAFATNSAERMRIDSSGRVFIGATSSAGASSYYDDLIVRNETSGHGSGITLLSNTTNGFSKLDMRKDDGSEVAAIGADNANGHLNLQTGGSTRLTINSSGNVLLPSGHIETGSSTGQLDLIGGGTNQGGKIVLQGGNNDASIRFHAQQYSSSPAERMRITKDGYVGIGTTNPEGNLSVVGGSNSVTTPVLFVADADGSVEAASTLIKAQFVSDTSFSTANFLLMQDSTATQGSITSTGSGSVSYNTTSDRRRKTNIQDASSRWNTLKALQVRDFDWISSGQSETGFIAQEVYDHIPDAVKVGGDDANEDPWFLDYAKLTPVLTKALQEAIAKIETLETEMTALKARVTTLENA